MYLEGSVCTWGLTKLLTQSNNSPLTITSVVVFGVSSGTEIPTRRNNNEQNSSIPGSGVGGACLR